MKGHVTFNWLISDDQENYAWFLSHYEEIKSAIRETLPSGFDHCVFLLQIKYDSVMLDYITLTGDLILKVILMED